MPIILKDSLTGTGLLNDRLPEVYSTFGDGTPMRWNGPTTFYPGDSFYYHPLTLTENGVTCTDTGVVMGMGSYGQAFDVTNGFRLTLSTTVQDNGVSLPVSVVEGSTNAKAGDALFLVVESYNAALRIHIDHASTPVCQMILEMSGMTVEEEIELLSSSSFEFALDVPTDIVWEYDGLTHTVTAQGQTLTQTNPVGPLTSVWDVDMVVGNTTVVSNMRFDAPLVTEGSDILLPGILVVAGLAAVNHASASLTLAPLGVNASGEVFVPQHISANMQLPSLTATSQGHDSTGEQAASITLPSLSVTARAGSNTRLTLPVLSAQAAGTVTGSARADISLPSLSADASATVAGSASLAISLPSLSGKSYAGALCSVTIGALSMKATGTTGAIGMAKVMLPLFEVVSVATGQNHGAVDITLPSLAMGATVRAAISLPSLTLTAIGTAVVTASYEAYAVNLKHTPRQGVEPIDEATRYTNYPFTHVVRYQGSYYGANSTGLYLLEGTTDDGTATPFAVQTAMTDFKTPTKKTLAAAYFSGRFGAASTISLVEGEKLPNTYSFTTPRGTLAQNHRQKFGKGTKGRYFALSVSGTGTCELDGIEPEVHQLTRRI